MKKRVLTLLLIALAVASCAVRGKLGSRSGQPATASLGLPYEDDYSLIPSSGELETDNITEAQMEEEGDVIIMNAVKDEDGEMVATDVITAAKVSARFRNVAERHGKVDLRFRITVPAEILSSKWQLRLFPAMAVMGDTVSLDPVVVTGQKYRKAQLRGYQHYQKFINSIITNDSLLIDMGQLEVFLRRNLPEVYAFKTDSSFVSDSLFLSRYGVDEQEAVSHYTRRFRVWVNDRKIAMKGRMFRHYVKAPLVSEGLRLDTVIIGDGGEFVYDYVQTINASRGLRKAEIGMTGQIFDQDKLVRSIPESQPLTFYISSISGLVDESDHYVSKIIERRVEANTACYIAFDVGKADINRSLGENRSEMGRIEGNLSSLARNLSFDIDSIIVTASASPEGAYKDNKALSIKRSSAVVTYFKQYLQSVRDSIAAEAANTIGDLSRDDLPELTNSQAISFISRGNAENWTMLDAIVRGDERLTEKEKESYFSLSSITDPDQRENRMHSLPCYLYLRQSLYPRLRTVKFDFYLHRKGMEKDTIHTTVLDTVYMRGVQAIRDRDYATAVTILRPYHDYNAAVAYCSMDYNASALSILDSLDRSPRVDYLLAIVHSRMGRTKEAARCYLRSCEADPSFVHRGNLDPEISALIERYNLRP